MPAHQLVPLVQASLHVQVARLTLHCNSVHVSVWALFLQQGLALFVKQALTSMLLLKPALFVTPLLKNALLVTTKLAFAQHARLTLLCKPVNVSVRAFYLRQVLALFVKQALTSMLLLNPALFVTP